MKEDMLWMKVKWMKKNVMIDFLLSLSVSFFGLVLIFGLGFVFPQINPYEAIKWIVIVSAVFFAYSLVSFIALKIMVIKANMAMKEDGKKAGSRKTSKK